MADRHPDRDGDPSTSEESYELAVPGPFGSSWRRATLGATALTLSNDGAEVSVPYADLRAVDTVPLEEEHGESRVAVDLVVLGAHIVLTGAAEAVSRLAETEVSPPAGTARYANEVVATGPLVRVRLAVDDESYYLYARPETAATLSDALRERKGETERE